MKVQINKICWYSWEGQKALEVEFKNKMIVLLKDAKVLTQLFTLFFENGDPAQKVFEIEFYQEGLNVILSNVTLVN